MDPIRIELPIEQYLARATSLPLSADVGDQPPSPDDGKPHVEVDAVLVVRVRIRAA